VKALRFGPAPPWIRYARWLHAVPGGLLFAEGAESGTFSPLPDGKVVAFVVEPPGIPTVCPWPSSPDLRPEATADAEVYSSSDPPFSTRRPLALRCACDFSVWYPSRPNRFKALARMPMTLCTSKVSG
jgi:hypothetical protein